MTTYVKHLTVHLNSDFFDTAPHLARVEFTQEDINRWRRLAQIVKDESLYCIEDFDYRCEFFYEPDAEYCEPVPTGFRQCSPRLQISKDDVSWAGYEKHGGNESAWCTENIKLKDLPESP